MKQKKLRVEDYVQNFLTLLNRLDPIERPTADMTAGYFMRGLRKEFQQSVASYDATLGFEGLVDLATRVEKRLRKSTEDGSDTDDSDSDSSDSDTDSDTESEDEEDTKSKKKKKKKHKAKKEKKVKKGKASTSDKGNSNSIDLNTLMDKIKELGTGDQKREKPLCQICDKTGHLTANCWYNPNYRGTVPPGFQ